MQQTDIRKIKRQLREEFKSLRMGLSPSVKEKWDRKIAERLFTSQLYLSAKTIFTYVSTDIEIDTMKIIEHAWENGKTVAVPRCIPETLGMNFYRIDSFDILERGTFGVLEPNSTAELITDFSSGICIVPGLSFDFTGFRLGYGKGYYDRFLSRFGGTTLGLCYSNCVRPKLPHGRFDKSVQYLLTERYLRRLETKRP